MMCYYIDGMDVRFDSIVEVKDFLLSLPHKLLYQFIDRYIYYGDNSINCYFSVAVIRLGHIQRFNGFSYTLDIVRTVDNSRYRSVSLLRPFMNRIFLTE